MTPLIFDEINALSTKIREKYQNLTERVLNGQIEALNDEYLYDHPSIDPEEVEDEILDLLILAWTSGNTDANDELSIDVPVDVDKMEDSIYRIIDGESFVDRIYRHASDGDVEGIIKVLETEAVHDYNDGKMTTAKAGEEIIKASGETATTPETPTAPSSTITPTTTPTTIPVTPGVTPIVPTTTPSVPTTPKTATGKSIYKVWCTQLDGKVRDTHAYLEGVRQGLDDYFYTYDGDKALYPTGFEYAENNVNCRCYIKLATD